MAGIGVLVDDGINQGYAYKVIGPGGSFDKAAAILDLSQALDPGSVTASSVTTFTNKTLDNYSNKIHADAIHFRVKANQDILKGQPVKYAGYNSGQDAIEVTLANQANDVAIGIAKANISHGSFGMILFSGLLEGINTSAYSNGTILYVDGTGTLTSTRPATGYIQPIAYVLRSHATNGAVLVTVAHPEPRATDIPYNGETVGSFLDSLGGSSWLDRYTTESRNADQVDFTYASGTLIQKAIINNSILLYLVTYTYTSGVLVGQLITRMSDSTWMSYQYNYVSGELTQKITIGV